MAGLENRVVQVEAKVEHYSEMVADLRGLMIALDKKVDRLDEKWDRRTDAFDQKFTKMFLAVIGIQITTLLAIVGGLFSMVSKLLPQ